MALSDYAGRYVLLIFYPGDDTPVCTRQLCDYRDNWEVFDQRRVSLLGISTDTVASHQQFRAKHNLPFPLLADTDKTVCRAFGMLGLFGAAKRGYVLIGPDASILYSDAELLPVTRKNSAAIAAIIDAHKHK